MYRIANMKKEITTCAGFSLIEALMGVSIFALLITALIGTIIYGRESTALAGKRARASFYAEEALEAVRNMRDESFSNLSDGTYGLSSSGGEWAFSGSSNTNGIFTRQLQITSLDETTKQITSTVTWAQNAQRNGNIVLTTYLANWMLPSSSIGNWGAPRRESGLDINQTADGWRIQIQGNYAYAVRQSGTPNFMVIDISNSAAPFLVASLNLPGTPQDISVSGDFAYIANAHNSQELQIVEISDSSSPHVAGSYNAAGNENGHGVFASGTTVYLTRAAGTNPEFYVINAAAPNNPTQTGSLDFSGNDINNRVMVMGTNAYIASNSDTQELRIVDISTPSAPVNSADYNLPGTANAISLAGSGSTLLLGRANGEVNMVNISDLAAINVLGTYAAGNSVQDISLGNSGSYAFLATYNTTKEFQVVDFSSPSSPFEVGFLDLTDSLNGIAYDSTQDRAFAVSFNNNEEIIVLAPQ